MCLKLCNYNVMNSNIIKEKIQFVNNRVGELVEVRLFEKL